MDPEEHEGLQVEQRVDSDSNAHPIAFIWRGARWVVNSVGRSWDLDGERHLLLMVQGDRVFELAYSAATDGWRLVRRPEDFGPSRVAT